MCNEQYRSFLFSFCLIIICLIVLWLIGAYKTENNTRRKQSDDDDCSPSQFKQNIWLCDTAGLTIIPFADSEKKSIAVSFSLNDYITFKDCFTYYDIYLKEDGAITKKYKLSSSSFVGGNYSYTFRNVPPGFYRIEIELCYSDYCCKASSISAPYLVNITSLLNHTRKFSTDNVIFIVASVVLLAAVGLMIKLYYSFCSNESNSEKSTVYILHYYDEFELNKRKANILKNFLEQSSLYNSVRTIHDEFAQILFSVDQWLKSILKERDEKGKIQKIILIDSKEEDEEGAIENVIFNSFLAMLTGDKQLRNDNLVSCDNLFVVQFGDISGFFDKLRNVVEVHCYSLPKHSVDLGVNLCSVPGTGVLSVKKHLYELYMQHPIRILDLVQSA